MRIPHYDAIDDKYCSITDSRVFRSVQSKLRRGKYKGKLDMSKSLFNQIRRQRAQQLVEPPAMPARGITAMAAAHNAGAFSFASADFQIESRGRDERTKRCEMEVLKMILVREGYVRRLRAVSKKILAGDKAPFRVAGGSGLIDLLVQTRSASLAVVHGVTLWRDALAADAGKREKNACGDDVTPERRSQQVRAAVEDARREPFMWNGLNYMLKMCDDTVFLADVFPLVGALGIDPDTMIHNPFMMPQNLDTVPRPPASKQANRTDPEQLISQPQQQQGQAPAEPEKPATSPSAGDDAKRRLDEQLSPQALRETQQRRDEEHVQAMAWVLIREERRARRQMRRARRGNSRGGSSRGGSAHGEQGGPRPSTQGGRSVAGTDDGKLFRRRDTPGQLHPLMDARVGSRKMVQPPRSPAGGMGTYLSVDQLYPPESRGGSSTIGGARPGPGNQASAPSLGNNVSMANIRVHSRGRLSWQEQAKFQMDALARSLEASAWPENAGTGRMDPLAARGKRKGGRSTKKKGGRGSRSVPVLRPLHEDRGAGMGLAYVDEEMHRRQRRGRKEMAESNARRQNASRNAFSRKEIVALAALTNPPPAVVLVCATVMVLLSPKESVPDDLSWTFLRRRIADVDSFLGKLKNFRGDNIPRFKIRALQPFLCNPNFDPSLLDETSIAAAALCAWALQVVRSQPQYLEWLGAEGSEALRSKTAAQGARDGYQRGYEQDRYSDDRYDSDDMTDEYASDEDSDWSGSYASEEYTADNSSRRGGRMSDNYEDDYGSDSEDYSEDLADDIEDDYGSDGFENEDGVRNTDDDGGVYNDDFEGVDDPGGLLSTAFGGPDEPPRYIGEGLGRTKGGGSKHGKQRRGKANASAAVAPAESAAPAPAEKDSNDGYGEDEFEDDEVVEQKQQSFSAKKSPASSKPPAQRKEEPAARPPSQRAQSRAGSKRGSSGQKERPLSNGKRTSKDNKVTSSTEQLAFMGRNVLCSVNKTLGGSLYFVNVYDMNESPDDDDSFEALPEYVDALAISAKHEETGKKTHIELSKADLVKMCTSDQRLLKPGQRAKLAKCVSSWLTDRGPNALQVVSPDYPAGVFSESIEERLHPSKALIQEEEAMKRRLEEEKAEREQLRKRTEELERKRMADVAERERLAEEKRKAAEAQAKKEEEERLEAERVEAERKAKEEAERKRAAEEARLKAEKLAAEQRAREEAEKKRMEAERVAAEEQARKEAEEKARKAAEEQARQEAEEKARLQAIEDARRAEEAQKAEEERLAAEERARIEELKRKEAEEKRLLEEAREKAKAAEEAEREEQERLQREQDAEKQAAERAEAERKENELQTKVEEEARRRQEADRLEAEKAATLAAEKKARDEAEEKAAKKAAEEDAAAAAAAAQVEEEEDEYGDDFESSKGEGSKILTEPSVVAGDEDEYGDDDFESSAILDETPSKISSSISKVETDEVDDYADDFENSVSSPPKGGSIKASDSQISDAYGDDFELSD